MTPPLPPRPAGPPASPADENLTTPTPKDPTPPEDTSSPPMSPESVQGHPSEPETSSSESLNDDKRSWLDDRFAKFTLPLGPSFTKSQTTAFTMGGALEFDIRWVGLQAYYQQLFLKEGIDHWGLAPQLNLADWGNHRRNNCIALFQLGLPLGTRLEEGNHQFNIGGSLGLSLLCGSIPLLGIKGQVFSTPTQENKNITGMVLLEVSPFIFLIPLIKAIMPDDLP